MLLQNVPYLGGATFADVLFQCACLGFGFAFGAAAFGGVVWYLMRRAYPSAAPSRPGTSIPETLPPPVPSVGGHEDAALSAADRMLGAGELDAAIAALGDLAARSPPIAAQAHLRLGSAWRRKRDFDRALGHLRRARDLGASAADVQLETEATERARRR